MTKDILSIVESKQTPPHKLPETIRANSRYVQAEGGLQGKLCAHSERRRENLMFCLAHFVYLIENPSRRHHNSQASRAYM